MISKLTSHYSEAWGEPVRLVEANHMLDDPATCGAVASIGAMFRGGWRPSGVIDVAINDLMRMAEWPVFTVGLPVGAALHVVWCNASSESSTDLLLSDPDGRLSELATIQGHFMWPGLSWVESMRAAEAATNLDAARSLLLLLPFTGDILSADAVDLISNAAKHAGLNEVGADAVALASAADVSESSGRWTIIDGAPCYTGHGSARGGAAPTDLRKWVAGLLP